MEKELEGYHRKLVKAWGGLVENAFEVRGIPAGNARKLLQAALEKLDQVEKSDRVDRELKKRLKTYDDDIRTAAVARNEGDDNTRIAAAKRVLNQLYTAYGISPTAKSDAEKREWAIDLVTGTMSITTF